MGTTGFTPDAASFDADCIRCARLAALLKDVRASHPGYHARPVPSFGDPQARFLIVGLAPGMHGANRTGRPFTGDHAGGLLYQTLHAFGFANQAEATAVDDGLMLTDCRIANAVKCLPPQNKPNTDEIKNCSGYLRAELTSLPAGAALLALGGIAHRAILRALGLKQAAYAFGHANSYHLPNGLMLFDSYHCSRYNTQTRRLTPAMFEAVFRSVREYLDEATG